MVQMIGFDTYRYHHCFVSNVTPLSKKFMKGFKKILSRSGVTTSWKRHDNNIMTGTFGFCPRQEVVSDEV